MSDLTIVSIRKRIDDVGLPVLAGLGAISALALGLRYTLLHGGNSDVDAYLEWLGVLRDNGGLRAFKHEIGDYTPLFPYMLLFWDTVLVGVSDNVIVKASSIVADLVCAAFVYRIVRLRHPQGLMPLIAFGVILFAPTVAINSTYWGQTDMIWVAGLVAGVYFFMVDRSFLALVAIGFAFAFKQQAVFLAPFLLVLVLRRVFPWRYFLIVPAVYVVSVIPAFLGGGSGRALLTVYLDQADKYSNLTLFAPTVYQWLPDIRSGSLVRPAAIWGTSVLLLLVLAAVVYLPRLTPELILALAAASALVTPFVLPRMHDRYFFAADVLTIVLAFWVPRLIPVALLVQMVSLFSYWPFLFEDEIFSGPLLAVFELVAVVALLGWIAAEIRRAGVDGAGHLSLSRSGARSQ